MSEDIAQAAASEEAVVQAPVAQPAPPPPTFLSKRNRFKTIKLEWPLEYDGKVYREVTIRRMTTEEVAAFVTAAAEGGDPMLPMFDAPMAVIDNLDPDDAETVNNTVNDFLPRSLRVENGPSPNSGNTTQA